jgi:phosphoribosyl 1,2-cyclic phosphodiesterase
VRFVALGVRGSTPAPGPEFVRYGGHTSCLAVYADDGATPSATPSLVLDAGTGIRNLSALLGNVPYRGDVVLTHLHWDHVQGLPFCASLDNPNAVTRLLVPTEDGSADAREAFASAMSPPHFPIGPEGLRGNWSFAPLQDAARDDMTVLAVPHKGGATYAVRLDVAGESLVYLPDHALHAASDPAEVDKVAAFVHGADVLLHDAQYVAVEQPIAAEYGHATIETVLEFADEAEVGALVLTHHAPTRTDDQLDALSNSYRRTSGGRRVTFALQQDTTWLSTRQ